MPLIFGRVAAICAALVIVALVFLVIRNQPIAHARLFFVVCVVLSLSVAILGGSIPGFLNLGWSGGGLAVRAGGALALFVLTYVYTPDLVRDQGPTQQLSDLSNAELRERASRFVHRLREFQEFQLTMEERAAVLPERTGEGKGGEMAWDGRY